MARFTNYATLTYNGGTTESNTVTGELLDILSVNKTAVMQNYSPRGEVSFVLSLINTGSSALTGLTVTDNLGGYSFNGNTVYPLAYNEGSIRYYLNGVLQTAPTVTQGPPLIISGITVPAGGNAILIYEANVTSFAPLGLEASITNQAVVSGGGLSSPLTAEETVSMEPRAELTISKALCPGAVTENGQLTYTFTIENAGSLAADAQEQIVLSDTFNPRLSNLTVQLDGSTLTEGTQYTYNTTTGVFATVAGQITVPAATYSQNTNGTWSVTPGAAVLTITGTV